MSDSDSILFIRWLKCIQRLYPIDNPLFDEFKYLLFIFSVPSRAYEKQKFISSVSAGPIIESYGIPENLSKLLQCDISFLVSVPVVEFFEIIDIDCQ